MDQPVIHNFLTHNFLTATVFCLIIPLSGCGSNSNWPVAGTVLKNAIFGEPGTSISRESVSKIPYAMITARVGSQPAATLVLASSSGPTRHWMATNEVSIVTHSGRIVQTVGFPQDIQHTNLFAADPLSNAPHLLEDEISYQRKIFYRNTARGFDVAVSLDCSMKAVEHREIEIVEIVFKTILMEENCRSGSGDAQVNLFWVDPYDGFVWQSRQKIVAGYPSVGISVLKPEG